MAVTYKVWNFPALKVRSQVFYAPGAGFDGGFTSGGARISSPEPGGRAYLEVELALQVNERNAPFASWLMSKTNGDIFKTQLVRTPQIVSDEALGVINGSAGVPWAEQSAYPKNRWDNLANWSTADVVVSTDGTALEGETTITINMTNYGQILTYGHVIGHGDYSYIIDDIEYNDDVATVTIKPPLRKDVAINDLIYFRPFFLGSISNGSEIRASYEASNNGHIQLPRLIFSEVIING